MLTVISAQGALFPPEQPHSKIMPPKLLPRIQLELLAYKVGILSNLIDLNQESPLAIALLDYALTAGSSPAEVMPRLLLATKECLELAIAAYAYAYDCAPIDDIFSDGGDNGV